jgi:hypothetical protein
MTLAAEDRSFAFKIMTGNADLVRRRLSPAIYLSDPGFMAAEAIIVDDCLMLPVLKREVHVAHLEVYDFGAPVRLLSIRAEGNHQEAKDRGDRQDLTYHDWLLLFGITLQRSNDSNLIDNKKTTNYCSLH